MFSSRKIGGIRFLRIGRLNVSFSVSRKRAARPFNPPFALGSTLNGTSTPLGNAYWTREERAAFEASRS